ncbi:MerR family transcriptional regulator [Streptomyces sp. NPDC007088]|uniref:MerR family transcriptional regulator n=1 Tax=Streptomyces sp. NPDC007088 TaxID=3364773 RepID=UPI00367CD66F
MLIGELARRTGTGERLRRSRERVGPLRPGRCANGYRTHDETAVETVRPVRGLLAAGLPTRVIRGVLPRTDAHTGCGPAPAYSASCGPSRRRSSTGPPEAVGRGPSATSPPSVATATVHH